MNKKKILGYIKPVFGLCVFMLIIYGAYTPSQQAEIQKVVCYKFNSTATDAVRAAHLKGFAQLRREIPQMVAYSAGNTLDVATSTDYDVVHYLTFRTKDDILTFDKHPKYLAFVAKYEPYWDKQLTIDANILK